MLETAGRQCQALWTALFFSFFFFFLIACHVLSVSRGMYSFGYVSFVCVDTNFCIGHWLGKSMPNITALEKCFCSQAAWQKRRLVQAPVYLSQVINFSPIKTPTGMMEKVGSLTFLTQASCGTLQCVGWWFLQSPVAENVQEWNTFLPRWPFCSGYKKDLLGGSVPNFFFWLFYDIFPVSTFPLFAQDTSENILHLTILSFFHPSSYHPSPVSPYSLHSVSLTVTTPPSPSLGARVGFRIAFFHSLFQIDISWSLISRGEQWVHSITRSDMKSPGPCEWEVRDRIK